MWDIVVRDLSGHKVTVAVDEEWPTDKLYALAHAAFSRSEQVLTCAGIIYYGERICDSGLRHGSDVYMLMRHPHHPRHRVGVGADTAGSGTAAPSAPVQELPPHTFVCPITHEEVVGVCGVTSAGSAYSLGAIRTWLRTRRVDPRTNLRLPSAHVWETPFATEADLAAACVRAREVTCEWAKTFADQLEDRRFITAAVAVLKPLETHPLFLEYVAALAAAFANPEWGYGFGGRPDTEGWDDLVDMRAAAIRAIGADPDLVPKDHLLLNVAVQDTMFPAGFPFKGLSFCGARVAGTFRHRHLDRTTWWCASFGADVVFDNCSFRGETVGFYESRGAVRVSGRTVCELGDSWKPLVGADAVAELRHRGLCIAA